VRRSEDVTLPFAVCYSLMHFAFLTANPVSLDDTRCESVFRSERSALSFDFHDMLFSLDSFSLQQLRTPWHLARRL
jgi:hypothetical protein